MENFLLYLVKVALGTSLLIICYSVLFRKETFYTRNRIILLITIILPVIIPLIHFSSSTPSSLEDMSSITSFQSFSVSSYYIESGITETINRISYTDVVFYIYLTGLVFLITRTLWGVLTVCRLIRRSKRIKLDNNDIYLTDRDVTPFSFIKYIVISQDEYGEAYFHNIVDHELAHTRQGHYIDLILTEFFLAFQWFNPLAWLLRKYIRQNHEYLADQAVSNSGRNLRTYQLSLLELCSKKRIIPMANNFSKQTLRNRIIMMNKKKTRSIAKIKSIFLIPVIILLLATITAGSYTIVQALKNSPFSTISENGIRDYFNNFLAKYPVEVALHNYEGEVYVELQISNGEINELKVIDSPKDISSPMLEDLVIVALEADPEIAKTELSKAECQKILEEEGKKIAKRIGELDVAEWNSKKFKFTIKIDYKLTPNVASVEPYKAYGSNNMSPFDIKAVQENKEPLYILNNEIVNLREFKKYYGSDHYGIQVQFNSDSQMNFLGNKATDGFSWLITRDEDIKISLADFLKEFESVIDYPLIVSRTHGILGKEEIEALDKNRTIVHFYMDSGSALSLFGNNTGNGLALVQERLRIR